MYLNPFMYMKRCYEWIGRPEQLTVTRWNSEISEIRSIQLHGWLPGQIVTDQCPSCSSDTRWFTCYVHVLHILQVIRILKMLNESLSSWSDDNRCCGKLVNYTGCMPKLPGLRPMQLAWSCCWRNGVFIWILVTRMISGALGMIFIIHVQESWWKALL